MDSLLSMCTHHLVATTCVHPAQTAWPSRKRKKKKTLVPYKTPSDALCNIFSIDWCPVCLCHPSQAKCFGLRLTQFPALNGAKGQMAQSAKSPGTIMPLHGLKIWIDLLHNEKASFAWSHVVPCLFCRSAVICGKFQVWDKSLLLSFFFSFFVWINHTVKRLISQGQCIKE